MNKELFKICFDKLRYVFDCNDVYNLQSINTMITGKTLDNEFYETIYRYYTNKDKALADKYTAPYVSMLMKEISFVKCIFDDVWNEELDVNNTKNTHPFNNSKQKFKYIEFNDEHANYIHVFKNDNDYIIKIPYSTPGLYLNLLTADNIDFKKYKEVKCSEINIELPVISFETKRHLQCYNKQTNDPLLQYCIDHHSNNDDESIVINYYSNTELNITPEGTRILSTDVYKVEWIGDSLDWTPPFFHRFDETFMFIITYKAMPLYVGKINKLD